jgi:hypothetical protein
MSEPEAGVMHPVDKAFYDLTVKELHYERVVADRLRNELGELRAVMLRCADKLEEFGNDEPLEVAKHLRYHAK